MKKTVFLTLALFASTAQAAAVYECTDHSGRKVYRQNGGKNCKAGNIGRPSVYTSAPVYHTAAPVAAVTESTPQPPASADLEAAQRELKQAQQALEEGKKVRLGNERNYAKYLERVQRLENNVKAAEAKVQTAGHDPQ
ncbi:lipoic acid synthetase [Neisseria iguanae]|uniref:Lipoic acid synthetase n=1 Tax=Neisseria iguanae TaxID=90242 RepID=A0A2P7U1J8_9NEIS|nr:lipoic acid synthetase [Neisseria iguanae]PSJ80847.1 lipoic acid synthetase [Neisseria iguanae]